MSEYDIERVIQTEKGSCQNACVAMLTDYTQQELIDEYGWPLDHSSTREVLEGEYEYVTYKVINIEGVRALCEVVKNLLVSFETPLRERDPELHEEMFEKEVQRKIENKTERKGHLTDNEKEQIREYTTLKHAVVVHRGRIYDPQEPPYFRTLGSLGHIGYEDDYEVCDVWVCSNRDPVFSWEDDGWPVTAGWDDE